MEVQYVLEQQGEFETTVKVGVKDGKFGPFYSVEAYREYEYEGSPRKGTSYTTRQLEELIGMLGVAKKFIGDNPLKHETTEDKAAA